MTFQLVNKKSLVAAIFYGTCPMFPARFRQPCMRRYPVNPARPLVRVELLDGVQS